jgi:hypothetical protein
MRLGHAISQCVLRQNDPTDHHHTMALLAAEQTPIIDDAGFLGIPNLGKQIVSRNCVHTGRSCPAAEKADSFGCAP